MVNLARLIRSDSYLTNLAKQGLAPFSDPRMSKQHLIDLSHSASDYSQELGKNIDHYVVRHPYTVAGVALALGVLIGGALAKRF